MDCGEDARHLSLSGAAHEEPARGEQRPIHSSEGGAGNEERHHPGDRAKKPGNSLRKHSQKMFFFRNIS